MQLNQKSCRQRHEGYMHFMTAVAALAPELSYRDLVIADGGTASTAFYAMFQGNYKGDAEALRDDLLKYCERDTWAMVVLMGRLISEIEK